MGGRARCWGGLSAVVAVMMILAPAALAATAHQARVGTEQRETAGLAEPARGAVAPEGEEGRVALTPPMGWNSWNFFHCGVSDAVVRAEAAAMASNGMRAAGYRYINIDDCWEGERNAQGNIRPNKKFPDMKALGDYIHSRGLKFGIYSSPGPKTCAGYAGSYGHEAQDARTYAGWGVDYLKYDWCSAREVYPAGEMPAVYKKMHDALEATGRPIIYSLCEYGLNRVWAWGASVGGNLWRTTDDISPNFDRILLIASQQNGLERFAGPGHWNDPDMLEVGNGKLTEDQNRSHMSFWCLLSAPLIAGNDLAHMTAETLDILTNPEVIAVDQDPSGNQGYRTWQEGPLEIWVKVMADRSRVVGMFNEGKSAETMAVRFGEIGVGDRAQVRDLWERKDLGTLEGSYAATVARDGVVLVRISER